MSSIKLVRPLESIPLSGAAIHGNVVYVSGQVGFKPGTSELVEGGVARQCRQTMANIDEILKEAGSSPSQIIRCGVYLVDIQRDFAAMNECYCQWMGEHRPARSTIGVALARPGILVEIDCVAGVS